ncbi:MAG: hypothetical protein ACOZAN_02430, partial [Patescibacteria group bacterium]
PTAAGKSSGCLRRYVKFMGSSFTREIGTAHHFIKRYFATSLIDGDIWVWSKTVSMLDYFYNFFFGIAFGLLIDLCLLIYWGRFLILKKANHRKTEKKPQ